MSAAAHEYSPSRVLPSLTSVVDIDESWGVECAWCPPLQVGEPERPAPSEGGQPLA